MKDELDNLTDAQISEVFAVEVANITPERLAFASRDDGKSGALFEDSRYGHGGCCTRQNVEDFCKNYPQFKVCFRTHVHQRFATSADAVLPFIEEAGFFPNIMRPWENFLVEGVEPKRVWEVRLPCVWATAPTFARAACIALIRAKRTKGEK